MDNFKCLSALTCEIWIKKVTIVSVDLVDARETLRRKLTKSMKIAKKFKDELKLGNLEKEELIVRLDESIKKNDFFRNQFSDRPQTEWPLVIEIN